MEAVCPEVWNPALVVVDVQNKFYNVTEGLHRSVDLCMDNINEVIGIFRSAGLPVVFIAFDGHIEGCMSDEGSPDDFVDGLDYREGDDVIHKTQMNCFNGSGLEGYLRSKGCDSVVLTGLVAHLCVLSTYFDAFNLGFRSYLCRGALAATDQENVGHVEAITQTFDCQHLRRVFGV